MKNLILIATLLLTTLGYAQKIIGNGIMKTITRTTTDYDAIKCAGAFDYILVAGTEGNISIEGEENLLEYIITEVKNNTLIVRQKEKTNIRTSTNKTIKITIPFKDISKVSLAGSGDLWNKDLIKSNTFEVSLAGSGDININVEAKNIKGSVTGSGDLNIKGQTDKLEASVAGSGDLDASKLDANETDISVAGSGDAEVVAHKILKARVTGSGSIKYKGNPMKEDIKVAGSGSISKK